MELLVRPARDRRDYDACVQLQREVPGLSDLEIDLGHPADRHRPRRGPPGRLVDSPGDGVLGFCYAFAALRGAKATFTRTCSP